MLGAMGRPRWSQPELAAVPLDVLEAARWQLYADRIWPAETAAALAGPDDPKPDQVKRMRFQTRQELSRIRALLLPPDGEFD